MKLVSDDRCRLTSETLFKPNTPYNAERRPDGRLELTELASASVPTVKARRVNGRWIGAAVKVDRQGVIDSIREDRESR